MNATIEKDFGDWLSPMLVKEIRQGFRSRVFISAFLLIQGLMIFCVVVGLVLSDGDMDASTYYFWITICVPLLLILPSHGFGVLGNEINANTLELLFLTRLSAWRIVAGKWTAIVTQTILIICSILPYMVLRYFIGGINLVDELIYLSWVLVASVLLTGMTIAISPYCRSMLSKMLLPILTIFLVIILVSFMGNRSASVIPLHETYLIIAVLSPLFLLLMFEIAVGRIAPPAENHSFRKKVLGFMVLGAIALLNMALNEPGLLLKIAVFLLLPVCVSALCEEIQPIPSIYLPFVKRGPLGRFAGLIFYPGWPSGLLYTIFAFAIFVVIFIMAEKSIDEDSLLALISAAGGLLMPLAVEKLFFQRIRKPLVIYLSLQGFMFLAYLIAGELNGTPLSSSMELVSVLPTTVFLLGGSDRINSVDKPLFIFMSVIVLMGSLIVLLLKSAIKRKEIAALEKIARDTLIKREPEPVHANAA